MKALLRSAALGLLLGMAAVSAAKAEVVTFARVGAWEAFGGTTNNGKALCGMSTSGDGKWFGVKYFRGDQAVTIQLSNKKWTVKDGTKIKVSMAFDQDSPWTATASAFHMSDGDAALEFEIPTSKIDDWLTEFRAAHLMDVSFPGTSVSDWEASLAGTDRIAGEMIRCINSMRR